MLKLPHSVKPLGPEQTTIVGHPNVIKAIKKDNITWDESADGEDTKFQMGFQAFQHLEFKVRRSPESESCFKSRQDPLLGQKPTQDCKAIFL